MEYGYLLTGKVLFDSNQRKTGMGVMKRSKVTCQGEAIKATHCDQRHTQLSITLMQKRTKEILCVGNEVQVLVELWHQHRVIVRCIDVLFPIA